MSKIVSITICLPKDYVEKIDEERGLVSRSAWIRKKLGIEVK